jgi:hypothetical protein
MQVAASVGSVHHDDHPTRLELLLQSPTPDQRPRQLRVQAGYSSFPPTSTMQQSLPPPPLQQQPQRQLVQQLPMVWRSLREYLSALATLVVITYTILRAAARSVMEEPTRNVQRLVQFILSTLFLLPLFLLWLVYSCCTGVLAILN